MFILEDEIQEHIAENMEKYFGCNLLKREYEISNGRRTNTRYFKVDLVGENEAN